METMELHETKNEFHQLVDGINDKDRLEALKSFLTESNEPDEDTDEQVIENLREAFQEMRWVERGESEARPLSELIAELRQMKNEL